MFDSLTTPERLPLLILLLAWAALLFGGFLLGRPHEGGARRMPTWTRIGSSLALVIAAWYWLALARESPAARFALLVAVGMTLGLLGDLFMAKLIVHSDRSVLGGIGSFGLGHVAYIAAFIGYGAANDRLAVWLVWLLIGLAAWYVAVYRGQMTPLKVAALVYSLLLASSAGFASGLALQSSLFIPLAVGCALFLFSDLLIAARLFSGAFFPLIDDVVWLTYGPAQMLIVFSVGAAIKL